MKHFCGKLCMTNLSKREGNIIYSNDIDRNDAIAFAFEHARSESHEITEAALLLRTAVLNLKSDVRDFPDPLQGLSIGRFKRGSSTFWTNVSNVLKIGILNHIFFEHFQNRLVF